jgi:hypothetical protein
VRKLKPYETVAIIIVPLYARSLPPMPYHSTEMNRVLLLASLFVGTQAGSPCDNAPSSALLAVSSAVGGWVHDGCLSDPCVLPGHYFQLRTNKKSPSHSKDLQGLDMFQAMNRFPSDTSFFTLRFFGLLCLWDRIIQS